MTIIFQSHGGVKETTTQGAEAGGVPEGGDISVNSKSDFLFLFPDFDNEASFLPSGDEQTNQNTIKDLDDLAMQMVSNEATKVDSTMPAVMTYWGQFLDHELTARTDRDTFMSPGKILQESFTPEQPDVIERDFKNARTPRFDLDSVYGGIPMGTDIPLGEQGIKVATLINGLRDPENKEKMRIGETAEFRLIPDSLGAERDLPRVSQLAPDDPLREVMLEFAPAASEKTPLIGDMRNDENLIVAQFHLSFLKFHNKVIDFLKDNQTGWIPDFASAQALTKLHYQWLIAEQYLPAICNEDILANVKADKGNGLLEFRLEAERRAGGGDSVLSDVLGSAIPVEFSASVFRFGHTMVRDTYDYNSNFGHDGAEDNQATFRELFEFTGKGGFKGLQTLPQNWIIDWGRFVNTDMPEGAEASTLKRATRSIDTSVAPPLSNMINEAEGNDTESMILRHLVQRNLRRGYDLHQPTGQALHAFLKDKGVLSSDPIDDVSTIFNNKPLLKDVLVNSVSKLHQRTPLWFYTLAEAENNGGNKLGELGSWVVSMTFLGILNGDPDSAISTKFSPEQSPLRTQAGEAITNIEQWMKFAEVLE